MRCLRHAPRTRRTVYEPRKGAQNERGIYNVAQKERCSAMSGNLPSATGNWGLVNVRHAA